MGNKGLFPGVAVPLAFFCTLFFRHRKKSVSAPWDGKSLSAPESARQAPHWDLLTAKLSPIDAMQGGFPLAPLHPLRIASQNNRAPHRAASPSLAPESARQAPPGAGVCACGRTGGFPLAPSPLRAGLARKPMAMPLQKTQMAFLGANNRRGPHCRALRLLFA